MLKRLGRTWYYIGIVGTIILIIMWVMTRIPDNPITGRGGPISEMAIAIEVFQIAYVVLTAIIIVKDTKRTRRETHIVILNNDKSFYMNKFNKFNTFCKCYNYYHTTAVIATAP
jgi:hypothetical protein